MVRRALSPTTDAGGNILAETVKQSVRQGFLINTGCENIDER